MTKAQFYGFPLHSILQVCIFYKEYYGVFFFFPCHTRELIGVSATWVMLAAHQPSSAPGDRVQGSGREGMC